MGHNDPAQCQEKKDITETRGPHDHPLEDFTRVYSFCHTVERFREECDQDFTNDGFIRECWGTKVSGVGDDIANRREFVVEGCDNASDPSGRRL